MNTFLHLSSESNCACAREHYSMSDNSLCNIVTPLMEDEERVKKEEILSSKQKQKDSTTRSEGIIYDVKNVSISFREFFPFIESNRRERKYVSYRDI